MVRWIVVRGSVISIRDQERRQKEVERRIGERMRAADKHVRGGILARQKAAAM